MLTARLCREILSYDPKTGEFDRAKYRHRGKPVGYKDSDGYIHIRVNGGLYLAHRLAWLYVHGRWPQGGLDHKNGNPSDNRIANLREANQKQNMYNMKLKKNNRSGRKGVCWDKDRQLWRVVIQADGRWRQVGRFADIKDAFAARSDAEMRLHGVFARSA